MVAAGKPRNPLRKRKWSIEIRRPEAEATILLQSLVKAVRLLGGKLAVFLRPFCKQLLQLTKSVRSFFAEVGIRILG